MSDRLIFEEVKELQLSISFDNILLVDGQFLQVGPPDRMYDSKKLYEVLSQGKELILQAIEDMYQKIIRRDQQYRTELSRLSTPIVPPALQVQRGSVWVMRLTSTDAWLINEEGYFANLRKQEDRDVYRERSHIKEAFLPYWDAAVKAGFAPEIRAASSGAGNDMAGWCLLVREKTAQEEL